MSINRYELVSRHNIKLNSFDPYALISVGNGDFAYTADITGMQTLYKECQAVMPLCTMSNFGWNSLRENGRAYNLADLTMNSYSYRGRTVTYPKSPASGEEPVYRWLRVNPHRFNLFRLGLKYKEKEITQDLLSGVTQELILYEGLLCSRYQVDGSECIAEIVCCSEENMLGISLKSELLKDQELSAVLEFPCDSPAISGSDWNKETLHESRIEKLDENTYRIFRNMDTAAYQVLVRLEGGKLVQTGSHEFYLNALGDSLKLVVYTGETVKPENLMGFDRIKSRAGKSWKEFWENIGIIDFEGSEDPRAFELERRIILSLYLLRIQCSGSMPPAETGLTCNSWYGKFHLEMHFWHSAYQALFHQGKLLKKSLKWYKDHEKEAADNAGRNGFKGFRWPKMVAYDGLDSPSPIAPLLIWQQPHIIYMLEMVYQAKPEEALLKEYWEVVKGTADFMADFAVYNEEKKYYELLPPLIPVQECHGAEKSKNPAFELEYWYEGLRIALLWAKRLGEKEESRWRSVMENLAPLPEADGIYLAHDNAPDTFERYAKDHPSMLMACGLLPGNRVNKKFMKKTLAKVLETWEFDTAWGWDFAVMAMTAARLGEPEQAVELLLMETEKNQYTKSGQNRQGDREDLPLYLPGNGSLLLAAAAMAAGFKGSKTKLPGFPEKGWKVCFENIEKIL